MNDGLVNKLVVYSVFPQREGSSCSTCGNLFHAVSHQQRKGENEKEEHKKKIKTT